MVKISLGGYDDGEGPSNRIQKRHRIEQQDAQSSTTPKEHGEGDGDQSKTAEHDENSVRSVIDDKDRSISVTITDPDVLDCCICYEPLTAPVFQCENGHIACSNCCARLGNKCAMCSMPIGYNRCRAIEKVLESIKISCLNAKYGCKHMFCYSKKNEHEKECKFLPCLCPHSGCDFLASSEELSLHFRHRHIHSGIQFAYDKFLTVFLNIDHKTIVLQEKNDANLFLIHNNHELLGNLIHITCIGPKSKRGFHYDILARSQGSSLILQSYTKIVQGHVADAPSAVMLLIPSDFFGSGQIKLDIRIKS